MNRAARSAPAAARNREPILRVLRDCLPPSARVLEIASGTGEHAVWFCRALPALTWQPTDQDPEALRSIAAWRDRMGLPNVLPPLPLDAAADTWPVTQADAIVAINMVHIAPWTATEGLITGAARILSAGGLEHLFCAVSFFVGFAMNGNQNRALQEFSFELPGFLLRDSHADQGSGESSQCPANADSGKCGD